MQSISLSTHQTEVFRLPFENRIFLDGPAGTGKTTVGVHRLLRLLREGVDARSVFVLVPFRTLALPYYAALQDPSLPSGGTVSVLTVNSLSQRMIELVWPLISEMAGFGRPDEPPAFLTLETAQYYMSNIVKSALTEGFFDSVTITRNRLYSQIIDNLNKAAVMGFPYEEINDRLKRAWMGDKAQTRVYDDAQICAQRFREYCLRHNLLDFSLQIEVFRRHLWTSSLCREYLVKTYRHIIVDNIEEDTPIAHDILREWLPRFDSALLIYDRDAGYRRFLGASPQSAYTLKDLCEIQATFADSLVTPYELKKIGLYLAKALKRPVADTPPERAADHPENSSEDMQRALIFDSHRFVTQMLDWVVDQISKLIFEEGIAPNEIVVLAPYLSDVLQFTLTSRLQARGILAHSHRPSRALGAEPAVLCLLTLARLAHPHWRTPPTRFDVALALGQAIEDLDPVRADLMAQVLYDHKDGILRSFQQIVPSMQERITFQLGNAYESLRLWLEEYRQGPEQELDYFLSRLFGEVLSKSEFRLHGNYKAGEVIANLVRSARHFRWVAGRDPVEEGHQLGKDYVEMVREGVFAAQYIRSWQLYPKNAVLLAPAYTFLLSNRSVEFQFWLDIGSRGWYERLYQPLTHPFVLSRDWPIDRPWTDVDEFETSQNGLYHLVEGLIRRCHRRIFLGLSEFSIDGWESEGRLLAAFQQVFQQIAKDTALLH